MGSFSWGLRANKLDRGISPRDQPPECQVAQHPVNRNRCGEDVLKHLPNRTNQFAFLVHPRWAHHESRPAVRKLHDSGASNIEQDAYQDVRAFQITKNQQAHPQRQDVQQRNEGARITAHLQAEPTEQQHHCNADNQNPQPLEQPLQLDRERAAPLHSVPAVVVQV